MLDKFGVHRRRRTREKELPAFPFAFIYGAYDRIPKNGRNLPLVDKPGLGSAQKERGLGLGKFHVLFVLIRITQIQGAFSQLLARTGLARPFRTPNKDGPRIGKLVLQCLVDNARNILECHSQPPLPKATIA